MVTVDGPETKAGDIRVIAIAFFFGTFVSVIAMSMLGLRLPLTPDAASRDESVILALVASLIFAAAITPLARGIRASGVKRFVRLAAFTYVSFAVINQIEAAVYSTISGTLAMLVVFAPPCLLAACVATWLVRPAEESEVQRTIIHSQPLRAWWWRLVLALLVLPILEAGSGLILRPFLEPVIHEPVFGLVIPSGIVVMRTLLLKSGLLLAVTVPILLAWTRSRQSLVFALAVAIFVLTGLVGLIQATWWPATMRIAMSLQVLLTSAIYVWVLVALLAPRTVTKSAEPETSNQYPVSSIQ